jgi:hypothetical protein
LLASASSQQQQLQSRSASPALLASASQQQQKQIGLETGRFGGGAGASSVKKREPPWVDEEEDGYGDGDLMNEDDEVGGYPMITFLFHPTHMNLPSNFSLFLSLSFFSFILCITSAFTYEPRYIKRVFQLSKTKNVRFIFIFRTRTRADWRMLRVGKKRFCGDARGPDGSRKPGRWR